MACCLRLPAQSLAGLPLPNLAVLMFCSALLSLLAPHPSPSCIGTIIEDWPHPSLLAVSSPPPPSSPSLLFSSPSPPSSSLPSPLLFTAFSQLDLCVTELLLTATTTTFHNETIHASTHATAETPSSFTLRRSSSASSITLSPRAPSTSQHHPPQQRRSQNRIRQTRSKLFDFLFPSSNQSQHMISRQETEIVLR